eukprot:TRINITY_DN4227_c0_g1_i3.p1 TRINITY_DN4227_c0_g1~~TRINITY_DN4227_c0_g1_i3.p1  ORF type:complete len:722 (+),score=118.21 TRINITY_DN4227_c0_g1_i3:351-2516(+)
MTSNDYPLPPSTLRNLRLYDKRQIGALEVEQIVKELSNTKNVEAIKSVLKVLTTDLTDSAQGNNKKAGLIGLAATAIGLGVDAHKYISSLVPPVLRCFTDQDSRVRYYACESLYNIAKVTRGKMLPFFNEIFDGLCRLSADPDPNVKTGAQLLDRLIKDIVTESHAFDIERFIPLLQERVYVVNPFCRQFLVGWVAVLNMVPDIDMMKHLPRFLDGMFNMLKDPNRDIRTEADATLSEFLRQLHQPYDNPVDYGAMVKILIHHCSSSDDFTRLRALAWVNEFIASGKEKVLPYSAQLLAGILPSLSHDVTEIETASGRANTSLMKLVSSTGEPVPVKDIVTTATLQFLNQWVPTRLSALKWVLMLHDKVPQQLCLHLAELFPALLKTLSDPSEEVVRLDLEVMAKLSLDSSSFDRLMQNLVGLFSTDPQLLNNRGFLIVRQLSLYIEPEKIFRNLATILETEEEPEFATTMIQTLNLILLTAVEVQEVRKSLKKLDTPESRDLFSTLYRSWAHSPASLFCLCLLCQVYEHAALLLTKFADLEVTVSFLMEIDKLVQLLESPIFIHLRLQLLEPERYPFLFKALYGLLMLLPQSAAFDTLRGRLTCISSLGVLHLIPKSKEKMEEGPSNNEQLKDINFDSLIQHFTVLQSNHEKFRRKVIENELIQHAQKVSVGKKKMLENATSPTKSLTENTIAPLLIDSTTGLTTFSPQGKDKETVPRLQ